MSSTCPQPRQRRAARFRLPVSVGGLVIVDGRVRPRRIQIET